jgi:hypothetical protein
MPSTTYCTDSATRTTPCESAHDVRSRHAEHALDGLHGEQQRERDREHERDDDDQRDQHLRMPARLAEEQQQRGECARARDQRKGEREDRDVLAIASLVLLADRRRAQARLAREHHVDREEEHEHSATYLEGIEAHAQSVEQPVADGEETVRDDDGDDDSLHCHALTEARIGAARERAEHRDERDGLDDNEEDDEGLY